MVKAYGCTVWLYVTSSSIYYYYSHIFPDSRAQHCNYATLLAGRYYLVCAKQLSMLQGMK